MPRKTRAAARAEEEIDIAVDANASSDTGSSTGTSRATGVDEANRTEDSKKTKAVGRQPLQEVIANAKEEALDRVEPVPEDTGLNENENKAGTKKGKGGKGDAKKRAGKKRTKGLKAAAENAEDGNRKLEVKPESRVVVDENVVPGSAASQEAGTDLKEQHAEEARIPDDSDTAQASPAVKMTRRQMNKLEAPHLAVTEAHQPQFKSAEKPQEETMGVQRNAGGLDSAKTQDDFLFPGYDSAISSPTKDATESEVMKAVIRTEETQEDSLTQLDGQRSLHGLDSSVSPSHSPSQAVQKLASLFEPSVIAEEDAECGAAAEILKKTLAKQIENVQRPSDAKQAAQKSAAGDQDHASSPHDQAMQKAKPEDHATATLRETQRNQKTPAQPKKAPSGIVAAKGRPSVNPLASTRAARPSTSGRSANASSPRSNTDLAPKGVTNRLRPCAANTADQEGAPEKKKTPTIAALKTPPKPSKSSKPITKSSFQLPGEAVAAKLKAEREERLKDQKHEEFERKRKAFQARPAPVPKPVQVKETAASKLRSSVVGKEELTKGNTAADHDQAGSAKGKSATVKPIKRASTVTSGSATAPRAPRVSTLANRAELSPAGSIQRSSLGPVKRTCHPLANAPNTPKPAANSAHPRAPSRSTTKLRPSSARSTTASKPSNTSAKGKEVFDRDRKEKEKSEKALKEKHEAAKRARIEAAERGRQASREWAEKMKRAKMEKERKAKEEIEAGNTLGKGECVGGKENVPVLRGGDE